MSFKYGQYGAGFAIAYPSPAAMRFHELVETRGRSLTIVEFTETGEDSYGQPVYTEALQDSLRPGSASFSIWSGS